MSGTNLRKLIIDDVTPDAFKDVDVQYPLPVDGDSIYVSDIDVANSDNGGFTGLITDYFDSLKTVNNDASSTNPKTIKIWFNRSMQTSSIGFGCDDLTKSFSNIVVKALGSGEVVRYTNETYKNDSTKRNSQVIDVSPIKLNGLIIEFHNTDEIGLSNIIVFQSRNVNARIQAVNEVTGESENILSRDGSLNVSPEYKSDSPADYYLYQPIALPNITSPTTIDDTVINVDSTVGVVVGHAITFYENSNVFQSIITATTATTITISSPIDAIFTSLAVVETGPWNMAVDGSITPQTFSIKAPTGSDMHIHSINCSLLDSTAMDDGKFGGIPALPNGIVIRLKDGFTKNVALITNNLGFSEQGFTTEYSSKAPAGQYGFRTNKNIPITNGIIYNLTYEDSAEFQIIIRDNLTGLDQFSSTINGHVIL